MRNSNHSVILDSAIPKSWRKYKKEYGVCINAECEKAIDKVIAPNLQGEIQLIFTSPPFPLNRAKKYGNLTGDKYKKWVCDIGKKLTPLLRKEGSIVIEIGNAWNAGEPTFSTLPIETLLEFKKECGLFLCQEFIYYNPARLPGPIEWVNKRRIRVKDSFSESEVYAKINSVCMVKLDNDIEEKSCIVHISIKTPEMADTDCKYFFKTALIHDDVNPHEIEYINKIYKPYFYEFICEIHDPETAKVIKHLYQEGVVFKAALSKSNNSGKGIKGNAEFVWRYFRSQSMYLNMDFEDIKTVNNKKLLRRLKIEVEIESIDTDDSELVELFKEYDIENEDIESYILNIGQANCISIRLKKNKNELLLDAGLPHFKRDSTNEEEAEVSDAISRASLIILTHWHDDHIKGLFPLSKSVYEEKKWVVPEQTLYTSWSAERLLAYLGGLSNNLFYISHDLSGTQIVNRNRVSLWKGKSKTSSNDSGLLLQVDGAVFSGDCNYKYWPDDFPSEKKCIHFVIPHHCGRVYDEKTAKRKLDSVNFSEKANAYACIGKNIYGHPNAKHEELLSSYFHRIIFTDDLKIPEKIGQHIMFNTNTEKYSIVPKM